MTVGGQELMMTNAGVTREAELCCAGVKKPEAGYTLHKVLGDLSL